MEALTYKMLSVVFAAFFTFPIVVLFFGIAMPSLAGAQAVVETGGRQGPGTLIKVILHYKFSNLTKIIRTFLY